MEKECIDCKWFATCPRLTESYEAGADPTPCEYWEVEQP
jgi:hypothetical protein